jgi:DNA-binding winged helix-turn-helix (wHTH) protein
MPHAGTAALLRFASFDLDLRTRELRQNGLPVKLQDLPMRLLMLLASRPGELVSREEIEKALWGGDQFVDFEHGINTAMRKIREALGDTTGAPRFIETLPRKGYRFVAPVEVLNAGSASFTEAAGRQDPPVAESPVLPVAEAGSGGDDPHAMAYFLPRTSARLLFLAIQAGYLGMYFAFLSQTDAAGEVLERLWQAPEALLPAAVVLAVCGVAVRLYLLTSFGVQHPAAGRQYGRLFPVLFVVDALWAAAPLLLARKIGLGLSLAAVAGLAYLPFAQRTLTLSVYRQEPGSAGLADRAAH